MKIPTSEYLARKSVGRQYTEDFTVEDAWALPIYGERDDFHRLRHVVGEVDMTHGPFLVRVLWNLRDSLGKLLGWGRVNGSQLADRIGTYPIPGTNEFSLTERLPADLRGTVDDEPISDYPFVPVLATPTEFLDELSNSTCHCAGHLLWVPCADGRWQCHLVVLVKPRGWFGTAYLAAIKPVRLWIIYPALMKMIGRKFAEVTAPAAA